MKRCSEHCVAALIFFASLALYVPSLATTVGWTDAGELMAVVCTLGIAHPTGYPLLALLSRLWLLAPFDLRVATQLNLFSAVLVAAAMSLFYLLLDRIGDQRPKGSDRWGQWPRFVGTGLLATSTSIWMQAASFEVYGLQLLLSMAILVAWFTSVNEQSREKHGTSRWWFVFALMVGFGFSNHMTTVLLAPALLWHYFRTYGNTSTAWRRILRMVPWGLVGLSLYLVLPIRSAQLPPLNWGAPSTWENFWVHVGGAQYRLWMFTGVDVAVRQFRLFVDGLTSEFFFPVYAVSLLGMIALWRMHTTTAITFLALAATTVLYSINYDMHEIGPYFLPFYVVVAVTIASGLNALGKRLKGKPGVVRVVVPVLAVAAIGWQGFEHRGDVRRSVPTLVEKFAGTVLSTVPPNSLIITGRWDFLYSPALYLQRVEHIRTDVILIDHSLLRDRSWYLDELRRRSPRLDSALTTEFDLFRRELRKFEQGRPFSPAVIQYRWNSLIDGIVRESLKGGPVYVDDRLAGEVRNLSMRPDGYLLRVLWAGDTTSSASYPVMIPIDATESAFLNDFRDYCASAYLLHAFEARRAGHLIVADSLADIAEGLFPRHPGLRAYRLNQKKLGD